MPTTPKFRQSMRHMLAHACTHRFTATAKAEFQAYVTGFDWNRAKPYIEDAFTKELNGNGNVDVHIGHRAGDGWAIVDFDSAETLQAAVDMNGCSIACSAGGALSITVRDG